MIEQDRQTTLSRLERHKRASLTERPTMKLRPSFTGDEGEDLQRRVYFDYRLGEVDANSTMRPECDSKNFQLGRLHPRRCP